MCGVPSPLKGSTASGAPALPGNIQPCLGHGPTRLSLQHRLSTNVAIGGAGARKQRCPGLPATPATLLGPIPRDCPGSAFRVRLTLAPLA